MDIKNILVGLRVMKSYATAKSPVLLVGAAVAGVVTTGVTSARAGYRARGLVEEEREVRFTTGIFTDPSDDLTTQEKAALTWTCYTAPAVIGISTVASCVGLHAIHTKRNAALAGLYAVTSAKLDDYQEKAEEMLSPKKAQQLSDDIGQRSVDSNPPGDHEVYLVGEGKELCYDEFTGRYFLGSMATISRAVNITNEQINGDGNASLNDFYDALGLPNVTVGKDLGWSGPHMDVDFGSVKTKDGRPALSFRFHKTPKDGYDRFR